jgi:hypothetical protein
VEGLAATNLLSLMPGGLVCGRREPLPVNSQPEATAAIFTLCSVRAAPGLTLPWLSQPILVPLFLLHSRLLPFEVRPLSRTLRARQRPLDYTSSPSSGTSEQPAL